MTSARFLWAMAILLAACAPSPDERPRIPLDDARAASPAAAPMAIPRWPADQDGNQPGSLDSAALAGLPACSDQIPVFGGTAVGPLSPGQSLRDVAQVCPRVHAVWDFGTEGVPEPALLLRFGTAAMKLTMSDTTAESRVVGITTGSSEVRTAAGVHPGSPFAALVHEYGAGLVEEGECVLYASFASAPGISFRLDLGGAFACEDLGALAGPVPPLRLPAAARVGELTAFRPEPVGQGAAGRLEEFGVLVSAPSVAGGPHPDKASFYFVSEVDPQLTPRELGFIRAADLLDAGARFTAIGDAGPLPMLASAAPQLVDSAFRAFDDVCTVGVPVPVRRANARSPWLIGLAAGGGVPFPPGAWERYDGGAMPAAYAGEAARLIAAFPDSGAAASPTAFSIATVLHTVTDGVEILVVDARRDVAVVHTEVGNSYTQEYLEQRFVIAERDAGAVHAPFRSAYTAVGSDASDWAAISTPALFLRMGSRRLLALHTWIDRSDGGGGAFIARVAPGRWSAVAGWAAGC